MSLVPNPPLEEQNNSEKCSMDRKNKIGNGGKTNKTTSKCPSKGKGGVPDPSYCVPSRALPRLRSGEPSKYSRMGDAVALVSPRIEGGLIRPLGFGEGFSALLSQTPKYLRTWDGLSKPIPVRIEGNLDITTPVRTRVEGEVSNGKAVESRMKRSKKVEDKGKLVIWNKGNSRFQAKKVDIEVILDKYKPLVMGILEANMGVNTLTSTLGIDGYLLERDNLIEEGCRTRTAVYISEKLDYRRRKDLEIKGSPAIWIELSPDSTKPWLLFVGYREWRSLIDKDKEKSLSMEQQMNRLDKWRKSWKKAEVEGKSMYIMGDLNIDVIPWIKPNQILTKNQESKKNLLLTLREMAECTSMELIATEPTRKQGADIASTLDILLTNNPSTITSTFLVNSSSDHKVVIYERKTAEKKKESNCRKTRTLKKYSKERMVKEINVEMINSLMGTEDTNLIANVLIGHLTECLNKVAPWKTIQTRHQYAPYLSSDTKEMMLVRNNMKQKAYNSGIAQDIIDYKKMKNSTLKMQRKEKAEWARNLIEPEVKDSKKLWKTVKKISRAKNTNTIDKITINGAVVTKKKDIAEGINEYFIKKVKNLVSQLPQPSVNLIDQLRKTGARQVPEMHLKEITMKGLEELMKGVKKNPSAGIDGISGIVLHDVFTTIKHVLLHLMNLSQCTGTYPDICKLTKLIPMAKPGKDPSLTSSYRPVANISTIGKLIERGVMDQVGAHLSKHNLTNKDQHGGRKAHSTMTCLNEILEDAETAQEDKNQVALTAIDLSAAYDILNHDILKEKCRILNLDKTTQNCISGFLADRSQTVEIDGERSTPMMTGNQGVVQGGPSSGQFFNIYIDELPTQVNGGITPKTSSCSTSKQYVDDGTIISRGRTLEELKKNIVRDFKGIRDYLVNHRMVINSSKTQLLYLKPHPDPDEMVVTLEGTRIKHQNTIKILGVSISAEMRFEEHVWKGKGSITKTLKGKAALMRTLKPYLPYQLLCQVGNASINSTILYCAPLWGLSTQENRNKVQSAQIKAARIITGKWNKLDKASHRQELLNSIKWPNVEQLIRTSSINLLRSAIDDQTSEGIQNMFKVTKPSEGSRRQEIRIDHRGDKKRTNNMFSTYATETYNQLPQN